MLQTYREHPAPFQIRAPGGREGTLQCCWDTGALELLGFFLFVPNNLFCVCTLMLKHSTKLCHRLTGSISLNIPLSLPPKIPGCPETPGTANVRIILHFVLLWPAEISDWDGFLLWIMLDMNLIHSQECAFVSFQGGEFIYKANCISSETFFAPESKEERI